MPIAGDTTKLPLANGLSPLEKRLAWAQHFLARHMPGSQQLRQVMGHCHFGARIVYGDCLFFTVSPNERHSCLVLRLSSFRVNDPDIKHKDPIWRRLAQQDFPSMEDKRRRTSAAPDPNGKQWRAGAAMSGKRDDMSIDIELPEYDLRALATARDPHAVVEGYKVQIYLRLSTLMGVRMCPNCLACNAKALTVKTALVPTCGLWEASLEECLLLEAVLSIKAMVHPTSTQKDML